MAALHLEMCSCRGAIGINKRLSFLLAFLLLPSKCFYTDAGRAFFYFCSTFRFLSFFVQILEAVPQSEGETGVWVSMSYFLEMQFL